MHCTLRARSVHRSCRDVDMRVRCPCSARAPAPRRAFASAKPQKRSLSRYQARSLRLEVHASKRKPTSERDASERDLAKWGKRLTATTVAAVTISFLSAAFPLALDVPSGGGGGGGPGFGGGGGGGGGWRFFHSLVPPAHAGARYANSMIYCILEWHGFFMPVRSAPAGLRHAAQLMPV
jgi:hypothetical protein